MATININYRLIPSNSRFLIAEAITADSGYTIHYQDYNARSLKRRKIVLMAHKTTQHSEPNIFKVILYILVRTILRVGRG